MEIQLNLKIDWFGLKAAYYMWSLNSLLQQIMILCQILVVTMECVFATLLKLDLQEEKNRNRPKTKELQSRFGLLGGFMTSIENLVIIGWSVGIQLTWWTVHRTWKICLCWLKKTQQQVDLQSYGSFDNKFRNNNCISYYDMCCRIQK